MVLSSVALLSLGPCFRTNALYVPGYVLLVLAVDRLHLPLGGALRKQGRKEELAKPGDIK